jgi:glycosyltransferase involved in cell wall biosynthesis
VSAVATLESIFANTHPSFEVILIDQSTNQETEQAIAPFRADLRFRYVRSHEQGVSKARNLALLLAQSPIIAYTDDDCIVPPNWLTVMEAIFIKQPKVAITFCNVVDAPYDKTAGHIPIHIRKRNNIVRNMWDQCRASGIGAGMALRRKVILNIGGFDEMLGPGAPFSSSEETDLAVRALISGEWIYETIDVAVTHYGFRTLEQFRELNQRSWMGLGTAYAKLLKRHHWSGLMLILYDGIFTGFLKPLSAILVLRKPQGIRSVLHFIDGISQGFKTPIDEQYMVYKRMGNQIQNQLSANTEDG